MNSSFSQAQLNIMNSILDKELDVLTGKPISDHENFDFEKQKDIISKDQTHGQTFMELKDITNRIDFQRNKTTFADPMPPSLKMYDNLLDLQSKMMTLERKLEIINSQSSPTRQEELNLESYKDSNKLVDGSPLRKSINNLVNDSLEYSPLRKKYGGQNIAKTNLENLSESITEISPFKEDYSRFDSNRASRKKRDSARKSNGRSSHKTFDTFALEQTIKEAEIELGHATPSMKSKLLSKSRDNSNMKSRSSGKKRSIAPVEIETQNYHEVIILNKKLMELRKEYQEQQLDLVKEKTKQQKIFAEFEKTNAKTLKMRSEVEKLKRIEADYDRLMKTFEKSEYIRNQQKHLIYGLQQELENLKRQKSSCDYKSSEIIKLKSHKILGGSKHKKTFGV